LAALGLVRPRGLDVVAGLLIGCATWYLNMRLVELLPLPDGSTTGLQRYVIETPLALAILAIAIVPAICEELLFRGVLLRALATRFVPAATIAISAIVFAAYHLSLLQLVPTLSLGLILGLLAIRARSAIPTMLAHLLNNGIAVLIARDELPAINRWLARFPTATLVIAAGLVGGGILLALRRRA
jgi:sodium transport system permease protein